MFCKYCGNELPSGSSFCPSCGKNDIDAIEDNNISSGELNNIDEPEEILQSTDQVYDAVRNALGGKILKFAIMGLAFGASFFLSPLGLVFSIISFIKRCKYVKEYGNTVGRATVGKNLGNAALIVSIVMIFLLGRELFMYGFEHLIDLAINSL